MSPGTLGAGGDPSDGGSPDGPRSRLRLAPRPPEDELAAIAAQGLRRQLRPLGSGQGATVTRDGRELANFSSNDYLGLANHPALAAAAHDALDRYGTGAGASRLVSGSLPPHTELETELARHKGTGSAVAFSSGYATAVGTITALAAPGDTVILDKLSHAALVDGARLSGAAIRVFRHNDTAQLAARLGWARKNSRPGARVLVVTESVFSMDGDRAPLAEVCELAHTAGALVLVDDAHAYGTVGPRGAGLAAELGLAGQVDLHLGTLSKAAGTSGGFLCASAALVDLVVNRARSLIYSTAPPPAAAAAAAAAVRLVASDEGDALRAKLWGNVRLLDPGAASPIIPLHVGDEQVAVAASEALLDAGFLVPAVRFPTVARGAARLRATVTAAHDTAQINALRRAIGGLRIPGQPGSA